MRFSAAKYLLLLTALILAGCASMDDKHRFNSLTATVENYRSAIRWGLYDVADSLRGAESSEERAAGIEDFKKIKVTGYKTIFMKLSDDKKEAKQTVEITFYHMDHMIEKKIIDQQVWKYDTEKKSWYLQTGLPEFK